MVACRPDGRAPISSGPFQYVGRETRGSVTLETAIAIPVLISVGAALIWAMGLGVTSLALAGHARDVARAIARGESTEAAVAQIAQREPAARVFIREDGETVTVSIREVVSIPLPLFDGLELTLAHDAVARREAALGAGVTDAIR